MQISIQRIESGIPKSKVRHWKKRLTSQIKIIAVHHEAGSVRPDSYDEKEAINQMATYHMKKNWGTVRNPAYAPTSPYHFCIGRSGDIFQLNDVKNITWHVKNANSIALGILLQGNLEKQKPTPNQILSLDNLLKWLVAGKIYGLKVGYKDVWGHKELKGRMMSLKYGKLINFGNYTACPASALPYVQEFRATGSIRNFPKIDNEKPDQVGDFIDLRSGEWYTPFAKTMIEAGVMRGYEDKTWRPAETVTRAEVAKIVIGSMLKMEEILRIYKEQKG